VKVSGLKDRHSQRLLFDEPLGNHGHVRTLVGDWTEDLIARLMGWVRHKTDCRCDYCPDLSDEAGHYVETKAAGKTNQTFVYSGRLAKDRKFVDAGHRLTYAVLHHGCKTKRYDMREELREAWLRSLRCLYLIPFDDFEAITLSREEKPLNSKYGNPTYGAGYRIPLSLLEKFKTLDLTRVQLWPKA